MSETISDQYKIELNPAEIELKSVIKNLARLYVYELTRFTGEDIPENGLIEAHDDCFNFDRYWSKAGHYPFIIKVNNQLAGFVLINKEGSDSKVDWHVVEFYIVAKYQGKGIGRHIAHKLLTSFSGVWEVAQMPDNLPAIYFWRSIIQQVTKGKYVEQRKKIHHPTPHEMIIQTFKIENQRTP